MIDAITWKNAHLYGKALASQYQLRHRLFIERNGWGVPNFDGMEYDQYDTPAAVYLVWRDGMGEARGISRLIPTTRPYMIKDLWPHLVPQIPESETVWEATRFGVDLSLPPALKRRVAGELVLACLEFGLRRNISNYLVVMPALIIKRNIGGAGCAYRMLGRSSDVGSYPVAAASVEVSETSLLEARRRLNIPGPVLADIAPDHADQEAA